MKRLFTALIVVLAALSGARAAMIWTVNSVADPSDDLPLIWLNASTINSNVFAAYGTSWGDNAGGLWTFKRADATATNTVAAGGPVESVNPASPAGRWFKLIPLNMSAPAGTGTNYWQLVGSTNLQPVDLGWQPLSQLPWVVGTNTLGLYGAVDGEALIAIRDVGAGETDYNSLNLGVKNGANRGNIVLDLDSNGSTLTMQKITAGGTTTLQLGDSNTAGIAATAPTQNLFQLLPDSIATATPYLFNTSLAHDGTTNLVEIQNNGTNQITFGPLAQMNFGEGGTNKVYRDGSNRLVYENKTPVLLLDDTAAHTLEMGVVSNIPLVSGATYLQLFGGTTGLQLDSVLTAIYPTSGARGASLGLAGSEFGNFYLTNQVIWGPGTTNVLTRNNGSNLIYTNSGPSVNFEVHNGSGDSTAIIAGAGVGTLQTGANQLLLSAAGKTVDLKALDNALVPSTDLQLSLGSTGNRWSALYLATNSVIYFGTNTFSTDGANHPTWNGVAITVP